MARTGSRSAVRSVLRVLTSGAVLSLTIVMAPDTGRAELTFSANVDKTTVDIGDPITLTLTLSGDLSEVEFGPPEFPEGFVVAGRSQSTDFSIRAGAVERATSLSFVLIPQQAGMFQLGPFTVEHRRKAFQTEPIEITVEKPALPPPHLYPEGERITL